MKKERIRELSPIASAGDDDLTRVGGVSIWTLIFLLCLLVGCSEVVASVDPDGSKLYSICDSVGEGADDIVWNIDEMFGLEEDEGYWDDTKYEEEAKKKSKSNKKSSKSKNSTKKKGNK